MKKTPRDQFEDMLLADYLKQQAELLKEAEPAGLDVDSPVNIAKRQNLALQFYSAGLENTARSANFKKHLWTVAAVATLVGVGFLMPATLLPAALVNYQLFVGIAASILPGLGRANFGFIESSARGDKKGLKGYSAKEIIGFEGSKWEVNADGAAAGHDLVRAHIQRERKANAALQAG